VEREISGEVTWICTDMQEFVNKQLLNWIQEEVKTRLQSIPSPILTLTIEQIREVVQAEQPRTNTVLKRAKMVNFF
jgi:hypothetical protein